MVIQKLIMNSTSLRSKNGRTIQGPLILKPNLFRDERGFFMESWNKRDFDQLTNNNINFVQDNHSSSTKGVLRGMHYQLDPMSQGKLVRCVSGEIYDVIIDIRKNSPTYKDWIGVYLDSIVHEQLWIPVGFAHGFLTTSKKADVLYKATNFWSAECEQSILWNDPSISVDWPQIDTDICISEKDKKAPKFNEKAKIDLF